MGGPNILSTITAVMQILMWPCLSIKARLQVLRANPDLPLTLILSPPSVYFFIFPQVHTEIIPPTFPSHVL